MDTIRFFADDLLVSEDLGQVVDFLQRGELVAIPTETVYGLAGDLFQKRAIAEIFRVKGRPSDNPLIAHVSSLEEAYKLMKRPPRYFSQLANYFWPGPLTIVAEHSDEISSFSTAGLFTIAIRVPSHPCALQILKAVGTPLVAPSANISGKPSPTNADDVIEDFFGAIPVVVDGGACLCGIESTVISLVDEMRPVLLRPGAISREKIEAQIGMQLALPSSREHGLSPGMKYRHYAPQAKIHLFETKEHLDACGNSCYKRPTWTMQNLYAQLREADRKGYNDIAIYLDELMLSDEALMNRLEKASGIR